MSLRETGRLRKGGRGEEEGGGGGGSEGREGDTIHTERKLLATHFMCPLLVAESGCLKSSHEQFVTDGPIRPAHEQQTLAHRNNQ